VAATSLSPDGRRRVQSALRKARVELRSGAVATHQADLTIGIARIYWFRSATLEQCSVFGSALTGSNGLTAADTIVLGYWPVRTLGSQDSRTAGFAARQHTVAVTAAAAASSRVWLRGRFRSVAAASSETQRNHSEQQTDRLHHAD
jgi:hypothetical protein